MAYTKINKKLIPEMLEQRGHHFTCHIYLINSNGDILLDYDKRQNDVSSYGGFSFLEENVVDTIMRELKKKAIGCIINLSNIVELLCEKSIMITKNIGRKRHYVFFCNIDDLKLDIGNINNYFVIKSDESSQASQASQAKKLNLYFENHNIVSVNLADIKKSIESNSLAVVDYNNNFVYLKEINYFAYKWFLNNIDCGKFFDSI